MEDDTPSQSTNEDPTISGGEASRATITLTPDNAEAKLAFSEVAEWLQEQSHIESEVEARNHARKAIWISPCQSRDSDVVRLLRDIESSSSSFTSSSENSDLTQYSEDDVQDVWTGLHYLSLDQPPRQPARGWVAGTIKAGQSFPDLAICLQGANSHRYKVRRHQALFQLHSTGRMCVRAVTERYATYVNGVRMSRDVCVINEPSMIVTFGALRYRLDYSRFAQSQDYYDRVERYFRDVLNVPSDPSSLAMTPTPLDTMSVRVGQWHVTTGTVGFGASGRVSIAINDKGEVVALKRISVSRGRSTVFEIQRKLEIMAQIADEDGEDRLLRLVQVITDDARGSNPTADVWFALKPAVADTLSTLARKGLLTVAENRLYRIKLLLKDILGATAFLHQHGWFHGDLKPDNVGIRNWSTGEPSVVLLDLDGVQKSPSYGKQIPAKPGTGGTIGWLSPEREMTGFTELTDIWSVGVMALWMINGGHHPWRMTLNPWRPDHNYTRERGHLIRRLFHNDFQEAVSKMENFSDAELGQAVLGMLRHPYAEQQSQCAERLSAKEALEYFATTEYSPPWKRARQD